MRNKNNEQSKTSLNFIEHFTFNSIKFSSRLYSYQDNEINWQGHKECKKVTCHIQNLKDINSMYTQCRRGYIQGHHEYKNNSLNSCSVWLLPFFHPLANFSHVKKKREIKQIMLFTITRKLQINSLCFLCFFFFFWIFRHNFQTIVLNCCIHFIFWGFFLTFISSHF